MARVRSQDSALRRLLAQAPLAVYALDDQRHIIYCNQACGELLGIDPQQLLGQRCDYTAAGPNATPAAIAASLCPDPQVFWGKAVNAELTLLDSTGKLLQRTVSFQPLGSDPPQCNGVLAFIGQDEPMGESVNESAELHRRLWKLRHDFASVNQSEALIGTSSAMQRVQQQVQLGSRGRTCVLVSGPSGSGREHTARYLYRHSVDKPLGQLLPLCCPLLDAELIQTTITSLVRQAGSSAFSPDAEQLSARHVPTLLLLEVDQLSEEAQAELAGFLSLPDFELYSIATSQHSLIDLAMRGQYRLDLAHALSTLAIELPPLSERPDDIPLLSQHFVEVLNAGHARQLSGFSPEALDELAGYAWPDNIDELAEVVELAYLSAEGPVIEVQDLPPQISWSKHADAHPRRLDEPIEIDDFLAAIEKEILERALRRSKGNKTRAAELVGMNRARFLRRLEHHGIS